MKKLIYRFLQPYLSKPFASSPGSSIDVHKYYSGYFNSFGPENPDKVFYVIYFKWGVSGFFSNLSSVLCHLHIAQSLGMVPVIDCQNFKTLYNVEKELNGTSNSWEYYFKPVSAYSLEEVYRSKNVFFSCGYYPQQYSYYITREPELIPVYNNLIHLSDAAMQRIHLYTDKVQGRVLGIHFRGQEQKIAPSHPFPPTEKQMIKYTDQLINKHQVERIFIVTEHLPYLELFTKHYGDMLVYTNSYRTRGENAYKLTPRENHRYLLGLEVLADSLLLSKCTGLLCGESNVSEFAKFANHGNYEFVYTVINGDNVASPLLARYLYGFKKITGRFTDELIAGR